MKKVFILVLVFTLALTACDAMALNGQAPTAQPTSVPPTAEVIVVTVEVPVEVPVEAPVQPTMAPTTPAEAPASEAAPTEVSPAEVAPSDATVNVDASLWGEYFADVTYSNASFSLRCPPKEITFTATTDDPYITAVDFYYRMEDRKGGAITEWKNIGRMLPTGGGGYSLTLTGESVHPDMRKGLAWFDFQLIGLNKLGSVVGRTEKIIQLVTYSIDCQ
jgi:hypothetical protein